MPLIGGAIQATRLKTLALQQEEVLCMCVYIYIYIVSGWYINKHTHTHTHTRNILNDEFYAELLRAS